MVMRTGASSSTRTEDTCTETGARNRREIHLLNEAGRTVVTTVGSSMAVEDAVRMEGGGSSTRWSVRQSSPAS